MEEKNAKYEEELKIIESLKKENPSDFIITQRTQSNLLKEIGILYKDDNQHKAIIKMYPSDFIVEEIQKDGEIIEINNFKEKDNEEGQTIYAELVKINHSTVECIKQISEKLGIKFEQIGYSGMKDVVAITSQLISMRGVKLDELKKINEKNFFLKNIRTGKGAITVGSLLGNRFSILARTNHKIDEALLEKKINHIKNNGLINYYGPQRFGSPRYISHLLGMEICKGNIDRALDLLISKESIFEYPYFTNIRRKIKSMGSLKEILEEVSKFKHSFEYPIEIIEGINKNGYEQAKKDFINSHKDQINIWTKGYASFLTNTILSKMEKGELKETKELSLLLSKESEDFDLYREYLKNDGTLFFKKNIRESLPSLFLISNEAKIKTRIYPKNIKYKIEDCGVYLSFELDKGAYATTFLMELFDIFSENDDEYFNQEIFDTKGKLGLESMQELMKRFPEIRKAAL